MPWNHTESHDTEYTPSRGCFPLCESCWQELGTPKKRLPFYSKMWASWRVEATLSDDLTHYEKLMLTWPKIEAAVLAGK
jgi:hypothetical protein